MPQTEQFATTVPTATNESDAAVETAVSKLAGTVNF